MVKWLKLRGLGQLNCIHHLHMQSLVTSVDSIRYTFEIGCMNFIYKTRQKSENNRPAAALIECVNVMSCVWAHVNSGLGVMHKQFI